MFIYTLVMRQPVYSNYIIYMDGLQKQYKKPQRPFTVRSRIDANQRELEMGDRVDSSKRQTLQKTSKISKATKTNHSLLASKYQKQENGKHALPDKFFKNVKSFNVNDVPRNAFILCIASRRSGKSHLITHFLEEYTKTHKTDGVFLFSKTNAGFDGIPKTYRFKDLAILNDLVETQVKVKRHNQNCKKTEKIKSNIILILDDMIGKGGLGAEMRRDPILNKLAVNGRHLSSDDDSNMMVILISQIFTGISPQIRLNTDFLFTTKLAARRERENIVNSFLSLNSGRKGLAESYEVFDTIVNADDFNFISIHTTKQNKKSYLDYVFNFKAPAKLLNKRLTGDKSDWVHNKKEVYW